MNKIIERLLKELDNKDKKIAEKESYIHDFCTNPHIGMSFIEMAEKLGFKEVGENQWRHKDDIAGRRGSCYVITIEGFKLK